MQATVSVTGNTYDWGLRVFGRVSRARMAAVSDTSLPSVASLVKTVTAEEIVNTASRPTIPTSNAPNVEPWKLTGSFLAAVFGQQPPQRTRSRQADITTTGAEINITAAWTGFPDVTGRYKPRKKDTSAISVPVRPTKVNGRMVSPASLVAGTSGVAIRMRSGDGGPLIGVMVNGEEALSFGFCSGNQHSMCPTDAPICWGLICLPEKGAGGFCTHDVQCKSKR